MSRHIFYNLCILFFLSTSQAFSVTDSYIYAVMSPQSAIDTNYVVQFKIVENDSLVQLQTYSTGGLGRAGSAKSEIIIDKSNQLLFVPNVESDDISVFNIQENGVLEPVNGSPFKSQYVSPAYLALHPSGKFLYAGHKNGFCWFTVQENGQLALSDSLFYATDSISYWFNPRVIQISPDGDFLYYSDMTIGIRAYSINSETGGLTELQSSPFAYLPLNRAYNIYFNATADTLFVLDLDEGIFAFYKNPDGTLENIGDNALDNLSQLGVVVAFSADFKYMFSGRKGEVYTYIASGQPFMKLVTTKSFGNLFYFSQLLNHPFTNTLYSFAGMEIFQHSSDNSGTLTSLRPPLIIQGFDAYQITGAAFALSVTTVIANFDDVRMLNSYELHQNYPNPFNPITTINYELPITNYIDLSIYDILGQKVATLVSGQQVAGTYKVNWNASGFASGLYFYKLETPANVLVQKMLLIK